MRLLLLSFSAAILLATSPALAQTEDDRARAREAFQAGVEAFAAEDFERALHSFQEAYRIAPHPSVRVNMANSYDHLGRPIEAVQHFERFLIEATDAPPEQVAEVRAAIERLRAQIGEVFLRIEPEGAEVTIDGHTARRAPILDAVRLTAGEHRVEVTHAGHRSQTRIFNVEGGARTEVRVVLLEGTSTETAGGLETTPDETSDVPEETDPDPDPIEEPIEEPVDDDGPGFLNTPAIITGGAAIGLSVTALALGISALGAESDFDDAAVRSNDPSLSAAEREAARQDGLDAKDRADRRALATDLMLVGGVLAAGACAYFLFFWNGDDPDAQASRPRLLAGPTRNGAAAVIEGTF